MADTVLIVTGSQALGDTDAAIVWAFELIDAAAEVLGADWIAHGNAPGGGGDAIATQVAVMRECGRVTYELDGSIYRDGVRCGRWADVGQRRETPPRRWPLLRNATMVDRLAASARHGKVERVACLALSAPWSRTNGALHTATLAMRAGLPTWVCACPAEYGPAGSEVALG